MKTGPCARAFCQWVPGRSRDASLLLPARREKGCLVLVRILQKGRTGISGQAPSLPRRVAAGVWILRETGRVFRASLL